MTVYVTDHAMQPIPTEGVRGDAIVLSGAKASFPLAAMGENRMEGGGTFTASADMKVVVSLTFADGNPWQARITPGHKVQPEAVSPATSTDTSMPESTPTE